MCLGKRLIEFPTLRVLVPHQHTAEDRAVGGADLSWTVYGPSELEFRGLQAPKSSSNRPTNVSLLSAYYEKRWKSCQKLSPVGRV